MDSEIKNNNTNSSSLLLDLTETTDTNWIPKGKVFNGTHYILSGSENSPLVVLIHGIDSFFYNFDRISLRLVQQHGFRVLYYDLLGRGFSSPHQSNLYGKEQHVDQLHSLLEHLQLNTVPFHLLGFSMGGSLATIYATRFPEEIKALTLLSPAGLMEGTDIYWLRNLWCTHGLLQNMIIQKSLRQETSNSFHNKTGIYKEREDFMFAMKRRVFSNNKHQAEATWQSILQFPLYDIHNEAEMLANQVNLPVHLVFGDKDRVVEFRHNFGQWKSILDTGRCKPEYSVFPDGGHNLLLEYPDETEEILVRFMITHK